MVRPVTRDTIKEEVSVSLYGARGDIFVRKENKMARTERTRRRDRTLYTAPPYLPWHVEANRRWTGSRIEGNGCWAIVSAPKGDDSSEKRVSWLFDDPLDAEASIDGIEDGEEGLSVQSGIICLYDMAFLSAQIRQQIRVRSS